MKGILFLSGTVLSLIIATSIIYGDDYLVSEKFFEHPTGVWMNMDEISKIERNRPRVSAPLYNTNYSGTQR
jgi:hypothetical protein